MSPGFSEVKSPVHASRGASEPQGFLLRVKPWAVAPPSRVDTGVLAVLRPWTSYLRPGSVRRTLLLAVRERMGGLAAAQPGHHGRVPVVEIGLGTQMSPDSRGAAPGWGRGGGRQSQGHGKCPWCPHPDGVHPRPWPGRLLPRLRRPGIGSPVPGKGAGAPWKQCQELTGQVWGKGQLSGRCRREWTRWSGTIEAVIQGTRHVPLGSELMEGETPERRPLTGHRVSSCNMPGASRTLGAVGLGVTGSEEQGDLWAGPPSDRDRGVVGGPRAHCPRPQQASQLAAGPHVLGRDVSQHVAGWPCGCPQPLHRWTRGGCLQGARPSSGAVSEPPGQAGAQDPALLNPAGPVSGAHKGRSLSVLKA